MTHSPTQAVSMPAASTAVCIEVCVHQGLESHRLWVMPPEYLSNTGSTDSAAEVFCWANSHYGVAVVELMCLLEAVC